ncbi:MAG: exodeoxyribonuclease VII small subunit [Armatimonadetes bacterium]|nr:exodeoxyribonuclease VII small subunit [Armatimonadota bacterium]
MAEGNEISFEAAIKRLEEIVKQLEQGELPLSESLKLFEEGIKLARECSRQLTEAQGRIEALVKKSEGTMVEEPFNV